ncbi:MAG: sigma-70 family RNA polymerase sigma factor [Rubrobacteraceae bacterium]
MSGRGGEEARLRREYAEHGRGLFGMAYRALGDRGLAEEVVQETFVRAWRAGERFDSGRASRRTWLFSIARNLIVDAARARSVRPVRPPAGNPEHQDAADVNSMEDPAERAILSIQIEDALGRISEDHRRVIFEVHFRDRPYAEVAEEMGVNPGTLRSRMYYALKALRLALEEMGYSYDA